ncbi:MAG: AAA family ATPase, partial [Candidatus Ornithomonoglobus sp.]
MYITKVEGNKTSMEGYCLKCAKELGLAPVDKMFEKFGIGDDEIEQMNDQMNEFIESMGGPEGMAEAERNMLAAMQGMDGDEDSEGGAATAPISDFMQNIFGGFPMPLGEKDEPEENMPGSADKKKKEKNSKGGRRNGKKSVLDTYGTDLTARAALGKVDRVVGRNSEVERVIQILNRRQKNNPVLLGEPGVGKTAVAEGLAMRIFEKNVPPKLFDARLYLIDFAALVAGTQFRGQFESRLKSLLKEAEERKNVILVIDEIHNIVAAGDAEGAMSAGNILKPALARGEIQIIGATTLNEYRKHIEKDSALERRFQPVLVDEPSIEDSIEILEGIKDYYENYHKVKISREIIEQAVRMSERYITDRFLPDKAIDVIDEAGSRVNLRNKSLYELSLIKDRMEAIAAEEEEINNETGDSADIVNYEKLANLHSEKLRLEEKQKELEAEARKAEITFDDIAAVIEGWTKIPVHRLTEDESEKLLHLEDRIHGRVIGQDEAVKAVSRAIRRGR